MVCMLNNRIRIVVELGDWLINEEDHIVAIIVNRFVLIGMRDQRRAVSTGTKDFCPKTEPTSVYYGGKS